MKRLFGRFVVTLMLVVLMTGTAFAGGISIDSAGIDQNVTIVAENQNSQESIEVIILRIAEKANKDVDQEIAKAQAKAEYAKSEAQLDRIIDQLLDKTSAIVARAIIRINRLGGEAVCEYVEVQIGGRTVLVDPLRIVRL